MSEILKEFRASANDDLYLIRAVDIDFGSEIVRICDGYEDVELGGNLYTASNIAISLPRRDSRGQQNITIGIWNATGTAYKYIRESLENKTVVLVSVIEYLSSDLLTPAYTTKPMNVVGGTVKGISVTFEVSFQDLLNLKANREVYTSENAKGIQFL